MNNDKQGSSMIDLQTIIFFCKANERVYQKMLYERFYGFALTIVFRYVCKHDKAMDTVNNGFIKVFKHVSTLEVVDAADTEKMLMTWLEKIMVNTAKNCSN